MKAPQAPKGSTSDEHVDVATREVVEQFLKRLDLKVSQEEIDRLANKSAAIVRDGMELISAEWSFRAKYGPLELSNKVRLGASGRRTWMALAALTIVCGTVLAVVWMVVHRPPR